MPHKVWRAVIEGSRQKDSLDRYRWQCFGSLLNHSETGVTLTVLGHQLVANRLCIDKFMEYNIAPI